MSSFSSNGVSSDLKNFPTVSSSTPQQTHATSSLSSGQSIHITVDRKDQNGTKTIGSKQNNAITIAFTNSQAVPENVASELTKVSIIKSDTAIRILSLRQTIKKDKALFRKKRRAIRGQKYVDPDFPTNRSALYLKTDQPDPMYDQLISEWLRLDDIQFDGIHGKVTSPALPVPSLSDSLCVRAGSTGVKDFRQGKIGNCWMVTALAALVWHHSHFLSNIIPDPKYHSEGIYQVFFCLNGHWKSIEMDDYFPCDKQKRLVFAQALGFQVYAPLMEKALAKHHSCYKALGAGSGLEGFSTLTGMPSCRKLVRPNKSSLWKVMSESLNNHYMMLGCCAKGVMGLYENHAYTILDVMGSHNVRALLIWNPWGKQELSGSLKQHHEWLKGKLPHFNLCPGMFWMRFLDFCFTFDYVDICKFSSKWQCRRFEFMLPFNINDKKNFTVFGLEFDCETHFEFTVYQEVHRNIHLNYRLDLNMLVFRQLDDGSLKFAASSPVMVTNVSSFGKTLLPGKYLATVISFNHWGPTSRLKESPKLAMAFHASGPFKVDPLTCDMELLGDMIIEVALNIGQVREVDGQNWTEFVISSSFCSYILVLENHYEDQHVIASVNTRQSHQAISLRSNRTTIDIVPPGTRQILSILSSESDKLQSRYHAKREICPEWQNKTFDLCKVFIHPDVKSMAALFAPRQINSSLLVEKSRMHPEQPNQLEEDEDEEGILDDQPIFIQSTRPTQPLEPKPTTTDDDTLEWKATTKKTCCCSCMIQ